MPEGAFRTGSFGDLKFIVSSGLNTEWVVCGPLLDFRLPISVQCRQALQFIAIDIIDHDH